MQRTPDPLDGLIVMDAQWDSENHEYVKFTLYSQPSGALHSRGWKWYPARDGMTAKVYPPSYRASKGYYYKMAVLSDDAQSKVCDVLLDLVRKGKIGAPDFAPTQTRTTVPANDFVPAPDVPWSKFRDSRRNTNNTLEVLAGIHATIADANSTGRRTRR